MKNSGRSLSLTSYDDLFSTDESRADIDREKVMEIPLSELFPFKDHPFRVKDDDKMQETAESIKEFGVPFLVAINKFSADTPKEVEALLSWCKENGYPAEESDGWANGGNGTASNPAQMNPRI